MMKKGVVLVNKGFPFRNNSQTKGVVLQTLSGEFLKLLRKQIPIPLGFASSHEQVIIQKEIRMLQQRGARQLLIMTLFPDFNISEIASFQQRFQQNKKRYFNSMDCTYWNACMNLSNHSKANENGTFFPQEELNCIAVPKLKDEQHFANILSHWIEQWLLKDLKTAIA